MIRTLTFTSLYPNIEQPNHGIFVENRLHKLVSSGEVETKVIAPVPWFPFKRSSFGRFAAFARVPKSECRSGLDIFHPRYLVIPKIGMSIAPVLMALSTRSILVRLIARGFDFDLIDAHYLYPDGVAAVMLGRWLKKPVVVTARGTDINLIPEFKIPRRWIEWCIEKSSGLITVSEALRQTMLRLGAANDKVITLRNGVDLELFNIAGRNGIRQKLDLKGKVLLSVGHLVERKGHHIPIEALSELPDTTLLIAGTGEEELNLRSLSRRIGVADRVRFLGSVPHSQLVKYYNAADATVLCSSREGMANVLLESIASGTPVVATSVWGAPEVITSPAAGILMQHRSVPALVASVKTLWQNLPRREDTRKFAQQFDWKPTTDGQLALFRSVVANTP